MSAIDRLVLAEKAAEVERARVYRAAEEGPRDLRAFLVALRDLP